jgi:quercetin dioxygenase-like cupin family protein
VLENPISGQQLVFRKTAKDTRGELLEVKSIYAKAPPFRPPVHYHPYQEERLEVLSGKLRVLVEGEYPQLATGRPHEMWNSPKGETPATVKRVRH